MTNSIENHLTCRRFDLSTPAFVFGGLFVATTALCTMEASSSSSSHVIIEEVKVAVDQKVVGPRDQDLIANDCRNSKTTLDNSQTVRGEALCETDLSPNAHH